MWWLMVVGQDMAVPRSLRPLARREMVRLQHLLDAAVEALDHAIGLRVRRWSQTALNAEGGAELIERVAGGGAVVAPTEQAVGDPAGTGARWRGLDLQMPMNTRCVAPLITATR